MVEKTQEQKVEFGLKNVHYAPITDDGSKLTYGVPIALKGAVEISIDPEGDSNPFYADDSTYHTSVSNQGYSGKLTIARLTDEFRTTILGDTIDDKGVLIEHADAQPKPFALLFEFSGDKKATRHVLYNVTVQRPSDGSKTKEDKIDPNTQELEFTAAIDPYTQVPKAKTTQDADATVYDSWYTTVYVSGATVAEG